MSTFKWQRVSGFEYFYYKFEYNQIKTTSTTVPFRPIQTKNHIASISMRPYTFLPIVCLELKIIASITLFAICLCNAHSSLVMFFLPLKSYLLANKEKYLQSILQNIHPIIIGYPLCFSEYIFRPRFLLHSFASFYWNRNFRHKDKKTTYLQLSGEPKVERFIYWCFMCFAVSLSLSDSVRDYKEDKLRKWPWQQRKYNSRHFIRSVGRSFVRPLWYLNSFGNSSNYT